MVVRLGAAVLLTGLAFATPALAQMPILESSYSLDLREGEGPVPLSLAAGSDADTVLVQLAPVDLPAPVSALAVHVALEDTDGTSFNIFAVREDSENFSWMTAGIADDENLTTGSVLQDSVFRRVVGDHADLGRLAVEIMSPLTDDALQALELAAP